MSTDTIINSREALTDLARDLSLAVAVKSYWRVELRFAIGLPPEDSGTEFQSIEAANRFVGSLEIEDTRQAQVIGPFERVVIELGQSEKEVTL